MHIEAGRLIVRSGRFKSSVPLCDKASFPEFSPTGAMFPVPQPLLPILRKLYPFVSEDERRPWACGVQFANNSAIATNSICIVEHWMPFAFPVVANIPRDAIGELLRLKVEPVSIQASTHAVTFNLPEGAWVSCSVLSYEWPDVQSVFARGAAYQGTYINAGDLESLLDDVAKLENFADELKAVHFLPGAVSTVPAGKPGTSIECPHSPGVGVFRADQLAALRGNVDRIGFGAYPLPAPFFGGDCMRGVMVGFQS